MAERARFVTVDHARLGGFAEELAAGGVSTPAAIDLPFALVSNAVNFGSGWHPHLYKIAGESGSSTIMRRLREAMPVSAVDLRGMTASRCADLFGQPFSPPVDELMRLYAQALSDLGRFVIERYQGRFAGLVDDAARSAARLAEILLDMELYRDVHRYAGTDVPLLKRAQLTAFDLGPDHFDDFDQLTIFADNLVPHVLRVEGVLVFAPSLVERIEREELIPSGSPEEVEIRAVALHACELIAPLAGTTPALLDYTLWNRGQQPMYKSIPRHRTRCPYY